MTPRLVVVIGANGAGKSTWCRDNRGDLPANFYDADSIAQGLGSYDDPIRQREARAIVDAHIERHLKRREPFGFESTYSGKSRPRIVERAAEEGYDTYAVFIGTTSPRVNVQRVRARVAARTGHHVPQSEIHRRWHAAQENLVHTAGRFNRIRIIDNSRQRAATVADVFGRTEDHVREHRRDAAPWANSLTDKIVRAYLLRSSRNPRRDGKGEGR